MTAGLPEAFNGLLTDAECILIDQTLLPTRDRFSIRITVYAWRYLLQLAEKLGLKVNDLTSEQIQTQLMADESLRSQANFDASFIDWFGNLLIASLSAIRTIAQQLNLEIEQLTLPQIVQWFEQRVKASR